MALEELLFQSVNRQMDWRMDDGQKVISIAHPDWYWGGDHLIKFSIKVRICMPNGPLFQRCQVCDWPPFFDKKYMTDPVFLDWYMKGPTFSDILVYAYIFHSEIFEAACSLGIQYRLDCIFCLTTSNKWVQKINRQYMNGSLLQMI